MTLEEQCGVKEKVWAVCEQLRAEEIQAISEAIGILNDDDALDVFKKAIPAAMVQTQIRFLQTSTTAASQVRKVQAILAGVAQRSDHSQQMKLMLYSLASKLRLQQKQHQRGHATAGTEGFGKVMEMVDDMVTIETKKQHQRGHATAGTEGF